MRANLIPSAEPWRGRLDHDRELQPLLDRRQRLGGAELPERGLAERVEVRRGDAGVAHRVLGQHLVGGADAGRHARAGVGDPQHLEQLLHGAVLAVAAVQRDERDVGPSPLSRLDEVGADVDRDDLVAEPLQRVLDARAGAQRHLALERAPALEDRDGAHLCRRACACRQLQDLGESRLGGGRRRPGLGAGARGRRGAAPVSVPYSATCSRTTSPIRRIPSRISSSLDAGEVQPHRRAAAPVDERRPAGHERDVLLRARAPAGRWCRCSRAAWPR